MNKFFFGYIFSMVMGLNSLFGQDQQFYSVEMSAQYGFILPHHYFLNYLIKDHVPSVQILVGKQKTGRNDWEKLLKYPTVGYGAYYLDLKNPDVLGKVYGLYGYFDRYYTRKKNVSFLYHTALGLSYVTSPFDAKTNYTNVALGSHVNVYAEIGFFAEWKFSSQLFLKTGVNITHFSNGTISEPNLGLNVVSSSVRLRYAFNDQKIYDKLDTEIPQNRKNEVSYSAILSGGVKVMDIAVNDLYPIASISIARHKQYHIRKQWSVALDLFYDNGLNVLYTNRGQEYTPFDLYYYGIHLSHDWNFGRVYFTMQLGGYLYAKWDKYHHYHRFGMQFFMTENLFLAVGLKTYYAQADFIEWGIGYKWKKKK